jgi:hypothetical protein
MLARGSSSAVECDLAKVDVAGSNPVSRSISYLIRRLSCIRPPAEKFAKARYPSGKGEVCKTFMRRFDPDPRLHIYQRNTRHIKGLGGIPWFTLDHAKSR